MKIKEPENKPSEFWIQFFLALCVIALAVLAFKAAYENAPPDSQRTEVRE